MTPFAKLVHRTVEKVFGRYAEGQDPPRRLREAVVAFANAFPRATREDWTTFASGFAEECWGDGYVRGVEWAERGDLPLKGPEEIADEIDPSWRDRPWRPNLFLEGDPKAGVPEERSLQDAMNEQVERLRALPRRF